MSFADSYREYLGGFTTTTSISSQTFNFAPRNMLWIELCIPSFNIADIPALKFNGDSGSNYQSRYVSFAAGTVTATNVATTTTTMARLGPNTNLRTQAYMISIVNYPSLSKCGAVSAHVGTNVAATTSTITFGGFEWNNSTTAINSITLLSVSGNVMLAGTMIRVMGGDFV